MSDVKDVFKVTNSHLHVVADAATEASQAAEKQWPEWGYLYHGARSKAKASRAERNHRKAVAAMIEAYGPDYESKVVVTTACGVPMYKMSDHIEPVSPAKLPDIDANGDTRADSVRAFAAFCRSNSAVSTAAGLAPSEVDELRNCVGAIDAWLGLFVTALSDRHAPAVALN